MKRDLFEYAIVRIVPLVEREEFINVGVILFCKPQKFLKIKYEINELRLNSFGCKTNTTEVKQYLEAFDRICKALPDSGEIGGLPIAERFRWLTASRSTIIQCSKVHPGLCLSAEETLEELFNTMVR